MKKTKKLLIPLAILLFSLMAIAATTGGRDLTYAYAHYYPSIQPLNTTQQQYTRIRYSGRPHADSIVIVLMGDGFVASQYYRTPTGIGNGTGTRQTPAIGTVLWHADRAITALEKMPPFDAFKHLFTVYVVHVLTGANAAGRLGTVSAPRRTLTYRYDDGRYSRVYTGGNIDTTADIIRSYATIPTSLIAENIDMIQVLANARDDAGNGALEWYYSTHRPINIARTSLRTQGLCINQNISVQGGENANWRQDLRVPLVPATHAITGAAIQLNFRGTAWHGTFIHEFGHTFGKLIDNHNRALTRGDNFANSQRGATVYNAKWQHWFGHRNVYFEPVMLELTGTLGVYHPIETTYFGPSRFERQRSGAGNLIYGGCIMVASYVNNRFNGVAQAELTHRMALISGETFRGRSPVTAYTIPTTPDYRYITITPNQKNRILDSAFHGNTALHTLTIPACINHIGDFAFLGATNLSIIHNHATTPQTLLTGYGYTNYTIFAFAL